MSPLPGEPDSLSHNEIKIYFSSTSNVCAEAWADSSCLMEDRVEMGPARLFIGEKLLYNLCHDVQYYAV